MFIVFTRAMVALNDTQTKPITLKRSIKQGCPLASLLFFIMVNALVKLIAKSFLKGEMKGLSFGGCDKDPSMQ